MLIWSADRNERFLLDVIRVHCRGWNFGRFSLRYKATDRFQSLFLVLEELHQHGLLSARLSLTPSYGAFILEKNNVAAKRREARKLNYGLLNLFFTLLYIIDDGKVGTHALHPLSWTLWIITSPQAHLQGHK